MISLEIRKRVALSIALTVFALPFLGAARENRAFYNSEEHQLIVDRGVAGVVISPAIVFPAGVKMKTLTAAAYADATRRAKRLAVGFDGNIPSAYSKKTEGVQDNCYWTNYAQLEENKVMLVPDAAHSPTKVLSVDAYTSPTLSGGFTLGQLAALYGDYRRTSYCDANGRCFLTNGNISKVNFVGGLARTQSPSYTTICPAAVSAVEYLQDIGSGLIPPYGVAGNAGGNSADNNAYEDAGWWGDEMLRIATTNDWHFTNGAVAWYVGMHRLALLYADSARIDPKQWERALHYEANALHSLTDLFALGHVLTNRDETSHDIMSDAGLLQNAAYKWMENVIRVGGGTRAASGRIELSSDLPAITDAARERKDFMASSPSTSAKGLDLASRAVAEKKYHAEFNSTGGQVRNLNGDDFYIFGDAGLGRMMTTSKATDVLVEAVKHSVQALFDAHMQLRSGGRVDVIGRAGSPYFAALKYLPVYVAADKNGYFPGRWVRYAKAVNEISGANRPLDKWDNCQVPYLYGKDWTWPKAGSLCAAF